MRLGEEQARERLAAQVHGVLITLHPERGPDLQPVVFAVTDDGHVGVPIDTVKPTSSSSTCRPHRPRSPTTWPTGLSRTVPQYADKPSHRVLVCRIVALTGWAASSD